MSVLENVYHKAKNIEDKYKHKQILFIGSESYDACTIGIIEGLHTLGFTILVYKKMNINSWFCNKIIDNIDDIEEQIDFVLSNLHWGTRWSLYKKFQHKVPYILIDGDDRSHGDLVSNWKNKYNRNCKHYRMNPPEEIKNMVLNSYRWMEDIGNYRPDKVFMSQKYKINKEEIYLPTAILSTYLKYFEHKDSYKKIYDISNFPGAGHYRSILTNVINSNFNHKYRIWNEQIYGNIMINEKVKILCEQDNNIHSWHRWRCCKNYFEKLMMSKILIISPVDKYNAPGGIGIKRISEGLAGGCYILFHQQPDVMDTTYPTHELCSYSKFSFENYSEMIQKCNYLLQNPTILDKKRKNMYDNAIKYFTAIPITRYFLWNIKN
jgi:hypothetical protein